MPNPTNNAPSQANVDESRPVVGSCASAGATTVEEVLGASGAPIWILTVEAVVGDASLALPVVDGDVVVVVVDEDEDEEEGVVVVGAVVVGAVVVVVVVVVDDEGVVVVVVVVGAVVVVDEVDDEEGVVVVVVVEDVDDEDDECGAVVVVEDDEEDEDSLFDGGGCSLFDGGGGWLSEVASADASAERAVASADPVLMPSAIPMNPLTVIRAPMTVLAPTRGDVVGLM